MLEKDFEITIPQPIYDDYVESFIEDHNNPNEQAY